MKQMDRRLLILMRLRQEQPVTARDLAEACECSIRTVYRDIEALCEAGVPVAAMPGEGYRLVSGYHLPPIAFTTEEATQLLLGADLAPPLGRDDQLAATRSAAAKVEAALDAETRRAVLRRRERLGVAPGGRAPPSPWLPTLLEALLDERVLRIRYHAFETDEVTERDVEPFRMYHAEDWFLVAYCRLRRDERIFRASRVRHAEVLAERHGRQPQRRPLPEGPLALEVRVWIEEAALPWARENPVWGLLREEEAEDGAVFVLRARILRDVLPWVLRWGRSARVLSPPEAVAWVRDEVAALSRLYAE